MPKQLTIIDETAMFALAEQLAKACGSGMVVYLHGPLGAGKTTFTRGFLRALGYDGKVKSPTFTLVESYELGETTVFHFDLYRLEDPRELEMIGIYEYFRPNSICLIEWPEKGVGVLPQADLVCEIDFLAQGRVVSLEGCSAAAKQVVAKICPS